MFNYFKARCKNWEKRHSENRPSAKPYLKVFSSVYEKENGADNDLLRYALIALIECLLQKKTVLTLLMIMITSTVIKMSRLLHHRFHIHNISSCRRLS